jgi:hypothetical protein
VGLQSLLSSLSKLPSFNLIRVKSKMTKDTKMLLKCTAIAAVVAAVIVWASNEVDVVKDLIG